MNKKKIITISITVALAIALLAAVVMYIGKVNFYKSHFFSNTTINGVHCGELEAQAVADLLNENIKEYELTITGRDEEGAIVELGTINGSEIALQMVDAESDVKALLAEQNEWLWFWEERLHHLKNVSTGVVFDETLLEKRVKQIDACKEENMISPEDAYIGGYSNRAGCCEIVPEVKGTELDVSHVILAVEAVIYGGGDSINLEEQGCYVAPTVLATDEKLLDTLEIVNKWLSTEITYDWNATKVVVDGSVIKDWIDLSGEEPVIDEEAVAAFIAESANKYDTYGKNRKFTTTLGVELTLPTGGFGWQTDREAELQQLISLVEDGKITDREPIYSNKAPVKGSNDIGSSYVEIDLSYQHLYLYNKGVLVFETDFVSGDMDSTPDCVTPQGVFDITYKTTNAILRGGDYEQAVSYWMPFYGNYGMHDASWRTEFGGSIFLTDGSHGCVNLPVDSAAVIYNYMYEGYPVICYYY